NSNNNTWREGRSPHRSAGPPEEWWFPQVPRSLFRLWLLLTSRYCWATAPRGSVASVFITLTLLLQPEPAGFCLLRQASAAVNVFSDTKGSFSKCLRSFTFSGYFT